MPAPALPIVHAKHAAYAPGLLTRRHIGDWDGRDLRVYVERDSDPPLVTTAAWEN